MKIKLKITIEQLGYLIQFAKDYLLNKGFELPRLQFINLKSFIHFGMKKMILASENSTQKDKVKTISFDVNLINAVQYIFYCEEATISPYYLALYIDMLKQTEKQLSLINAIPG